MVSAGLLTPEQYLHTSFEHDAEFVEGRIVERPLPTWEHSSIQAYLIYAFYNGLPPGWSAVPEQRVQTRPDRFRVPDVCVVREAPAGPVGRRIVTTPPYLCIEISDTLEKVREYLHFGVEWVWLIDPATRTGQIHTPSGVTAVENAKFFTELFEIDLTYARM